MDEPLEKKILSWLNTQGYDVEMKVATTLSAAGYEVVQSSFYSDPETGIPREIDVIGRMCDRTGFLYIYPVIECKKSSKPWIVFTSDIITYNRVHSFAIMTEKAFKAIDNNVESMAQSKWFMNEGRVGYGITEAFTSKEDETFKAGMTATKASLALLKKDIASSFGNFITFFIPTVVFDGQLFECYFAEDGMQIVEKIDSAFLLYSIPLGNSIGSGIRVVTLKAFEKFCRDLNDLYRFLWKGLSEDISKLATSIGLSPDRVRQLKDTEI